jgi:hypothetical protein
MDDARADLKSDLLKDLEEQRQTCSYRSNPHHFERAPAPHRSGRPLLLTLLSVPGEADHVLTGGKTTVSRASFQPQVGTGGARIRSYRTIRLAKQSSDCRAG